VDKVVGSEGGWLGIAPKWWTLAVIGSGTFMSALDTSIVNVALPVIASTTRSAVSTVEWVSLTYLIVVSASLLVFGRLADIHGRRKIYIAGQMVFVLGSFGCGLSGHVAGLIAARAVQALGAAMIFALSPAILISAFPENERGRALGMQATLTYLGMSIGPGLSGVLVQHFGWPSIFFVNVPVGLGMALVARKVLRESQQNVPQPFDPAGATAMAVALAALLFVLSKGGDWGWRHPLILGLGAVASAAWIAFVVIERRLSHPALDLRLFGNRVFSASVLAAFLCYAASASVTFLIPFFLLAGAGLSPSRTGAFMVAIPLGMMLLTGASGWLSDRVGSRLPATLGMAVMGVGVGLLSGVRLDFAPSHLAGCLALVGVGAGLFTAPNNSALMGASPKDRRGVAGAILAAARTVGFASGIALAGMVYTACLTREGHTPQGIAHAAHRGLSMTLLLVATGTACSALRGESASGLRRGAQERS
jgi:EmrB/QacA subfamily drug resistance transporter